MYQVKVQNEVVGKFDNLIFIRLSKNGCYVPCDESLAGGICVKLPRQEEREVVNEETQEVTTERVTVYEDTVFAFENGLTGEEPVCTIEKTEG